MTVGYAAISVLGIIAFFGSADNPVGGLFIGLTGIYVSDFFASLGKDAPKISRMGLKSLGFWHLGTGFWLLYLMFGVTLDFVLKWNLPT